MLSEEQEMIWLCGSGEAFGAAAFGDAPGDAAGAGLAFALECVLNTIMNTRRIIASGADAIAENRLGTFIVGLTSVTWTERKIARGAYQKKGGAQPSSRGSRRTYRQTKSENNR